MALQITSMADIFIIVLVFLLKSFATGSLAVTPSPGLRLPQAITDDSAVRALTVEISESSVQIENQVVSLLSEFKFRPQDIRSDGVVTKLDLALFTERKRQELISQSNSDVANDSNILIVADQRTPYATIKSVLASAAIHGFTDFKLVVVKKE